MRYSSRAVIGLTATAEVITPRAFLGLTATATFHPPPRAFLGLSASAAIRTDVTAFVGLSATSRFTPVHALAHLGLTAGSTTIEAPHQRTALIGVYADASLDNGDKSYASRIGLHGSVSVS